MAGKRLTIILLSDGAGKARQLKLPAFFSKFFILILFSFVLFGGWLLQDYHSIRGQISELYSLRHENKQQKRQIISLSQKIGQISKKMIEMREFDRKLKVMVNLEPESDNSQFVGIGGSDPSLLNPDYTIEKAHRKLVRLMHQTLENLDMEIAVQVNEKAELCKYLENQKSLLACTPSIWPTEGWISSRFGYRISPFTNEKEFHRGLDICARVGTPIIAPADGIVSSVGEDYGYGKMLLINHTSGLKTKFAHLSKALVKRGQHVKRGEEIALVGNTGRTTGPHLHYEVHLNGIAVDPLRYILN